MKKLTTIILTLLIGINLSACSKADNFNDNRKPFYIDITNNTDSSIYALNFTYYIDEKKINTITLSFLKDKEVEEFEIGKVFPKDFIDLDFPKNCDLSQFSLKIAVVKKDKTQKECPDIIKLSPEYGKSYKYSLTGNWDDGYNILPIS